MKNFGFAFLLIAAIIGCKNRSEDKSGQVTAQAKSTVTNWRSTHDYDVVIEEPELHQYSNMDSMYYTQEISSSGLKHVLHVVYYSNNLDVAVTVPHRVDTTTTDGVVHQGKWVY